MPTPQEFNVAGRREARTRLGQDRLDPPRRRRGHHDGLRPRTGRRPARVDQRAALLLFSPNFGLAGAEAAADIMAEALGWDAPRKIKELAQYRDRELAVEHAPPSEDG